MTRADVENALRVEAQTWAQANALVFAWDNADPKNPHAAKTLAWSFQPAEPEQLTDLVVQHRGTVEAEVYVGAGDGALEALQLAEGLRSLFAGRVYAGGETLHEVRIDPVGRVGTSFVVSVSIPWEFAERRVPRGAVGLHETPGAVIAYQAFRQRWEQMVRAPLSLRTFFDNSPPSAAEQPPWAFASFRLLAPVRLETTTIRVPGRVIAALNFSQGIGVQACEVATAAIERAFHQITFRGVCFATPTVTRVGRTPADTWQTNVRLPFHYDVRT